MRIEIEDRVFFLVDSSLPFSDYRSPLALLVDLEKYSIISEWFRMESALRWIESSELRADLRLFADWPEKQQINSSSARKKERIYFLSSCQKGKRQDYSPIYKLKENERSPATDRSCWRVIVTSRKNIQVDHDSLPRRMRDEVKIVLGNISSSPLSLRQPMIIDRANESSWRLISPFSLRLIFRRWWMFDIRWETLLLLLLSKVRK